MALTLTEKYYTMQNLLAQAQGLEMQIKHADTELGLGKLRNELLAVLGKLNSVATKKAGAEHA
jgi:hypothetical protein